MFCNEHLSRSTVVLHVTFLGKFIVGSQTEHIKTSAQIPTNDVEDVNEFGELQ
jgi:hypothetical protein